MKFRHLLFALLAFTCLLSAEAQQTSYSDLVEQAWNSYQEKDFEASADFYIQAFLTNEGQGFSGDRYNAACSYALSGQKEKSFYHLFRLANISNYTNLSHINKDDDLNSLHNDPLWQILILKITENKEIAEADLDKELVQKLDVIYIEDQKYRKQLDSIESNFGRKSKEIKAHWKMINKKDEENLVEVKKILDNRGWLGEDVVGRRGNSTLFLVIQHADLETQEKYLPMMRQAVVDGKASGSSLALLEDRVALRKGKKQIYGSQIGRDKKSGEYYVSPLIDPEKVDERRSSVGLGTLDSYCKNWDFNWDIEKHKERHGL